VGAGVVGKNVGPRDGLRVGLAVGGKVGLLVGGGKVGLLVGAKVGASVGQIPHVAPTDNASCTDSFSMHSVTVWV
jgi:hypothetical protein